MGIVGTLRRRLVGDVQPIEASSWKEACAAADSYGSEVINRFRLARSLGRQPDGSLLRNSVLGLVTRLLNKPDPVITDFGGGTGDLGADLLLAYPEATYTVVENPALVGLVKGELRGVSFSTAMPPTCDIFFSSAALQYIEDPDPILKAGIASARHAVVLVRNCFSDRVRFGVQKSPLFDNGVGPVPAGWRDHEISYPHRTLVERDAVSAVEAQGFVCLAALEEQSGVVIPGAYGRQLVFWRLGCGPASNTGN